MLFWASTKCLGTAWPSVTPFIHLTNSSCGCRLPKCYPVHALAWASRTQVLPILFKYYMSITYHTITQVFITWIDFRLTTYRWFIMMELWSIAHLIMHASHTLSFTLLEAFMHIHMKAAASRGNQCCCSQIVPHSSSLKLTPFTHGVIINKMQHHFSVFRFLLLQKTRMGTPQLWLLAMISCCCSPHAVWDCTNNSQAGTIAPARPPFSLQNKIRSTHLL